VIRVSDAQAGGDRLRDLFAPHAKTVGLEGTYVIIGHHL
jgi:hypothetical protein